MSVGPTGPVRPAPGTVSDAEAGGTVDGDEAGGTAGCPSGKGDRSDPKVISQIPSPPSATSATSATRMTTRPCGRFTRAPDHTDAERETEGDGEPGAASMLIRRPNDPRKLVTATPIPNAVQTRAATCAPSS